MGKLSKVFLTIALLVTVMLPVYSSAGTSISNPSADLSQPGAIGATTPSTGKFTTIQATTGAGAGKLMTSDANGLGSWGVTMAAPGAIGGTTPAAGTFTTLTTTGDANIGSTSAGKNLSVNATLGTELVTWTDAGWNEDASTWTFAAGVLTHVTGNTTTVTATLTAAVVAGTTYKVTITGTGGGATASYTLGGVSGTTIAATGAIAITDYITASTTGSLIIPPANTCTVALSAISVKAMTDATGDLTVGGNIVTYSPIKMAYGSSAYPSLVFIGDETSGLYRYANGVWSFSSTGTEKIRIYGSTLQLMDNYYSIKMGTSSDVILTRDAANNFAVRNATSQQIFGIYNTWTNTSNYERIVITGVQGASVNLTAETLGTGGDNLDVILTPAGTGLVKFKEDSANSSATTNTGGGMTTRIAEAVSAALSGASGSIAVNVPAGARILGVQLRVDTAITSGDGATSWTAAYVNTPTTAITSGQAFTKSTKVNAIHPAYELTTDVVTITITPDAHTFSAGVVRAVVYYQDFIALSDAP